MLQYLGSRRKNEDILNILLRKFSEIGVNLTEQHCIINYKIRFIDSNIYVKIFILGFPYRLNNFKMAKIQQISLGEKNQSQILLTMTNFSLFFTKFPTNRSLADKYKSNFSRADGWTRWKKYILTILQTFENLRHLYLYAIYKSYFVFCKANWISNLHFSSEP